MKELEQAVEALTELRVQALKAKNGTLEKSLFDIEQMIFKAQDSLQSKGKTKEEVKTDMRYHAVQFAGFILKHAETFTTKEGMFTWKRPNGEEQGSSELYSDWIEEYGEQPLLSEILERTQQQQKEALKRRDNRGNYLDNLRPMDI